MPAPELAAALERLSDVRDDERSWVVLYRTVRAVVMTIAGRWTHGQLDAAEDILQEVLVRIALYCDFARVADPAAFRSYLYVITRNVCRDHVRAGERRTLTALREAPEPTSAALHEQSEADNLRLWLRKQLMPPDRHLLQLILEDRSVTEIAKALDIDPAAARVRIHRLRRKLRGHVASLSPK